MQAIVFRTMSAIRLIQKASRKMKAQFDHRDRFATALTGMTLAIGFACAQGALADDGRSTRVSAPQVSETRAGDAKSANPAVGLWELAYDSQGTQVVDRYEILASESGELTGKLLRNDKEITKLEKIRVEDGKLSFQATGTTEGVEWKAELSGKIMGDDIDGSVKITVNDQTFDLPWNPKRVKKDK